MSSGVHVQFFCYNIAGRLALTFVMEIEGVVQGWGHIQFMLFAEVPQYLFGHSKTLRSSVSRVHTLEAPAAYLEGRCAA